MTTKDQVAQLIVAEAKARGYTRDECLAVKSTLYQESEWDEEVWDPTHTTYGVAQQDASYIHRFDGAAAQVKAFFDKLDIWRRKPGASTDIWLNIAWMQQRPNWESAQYWFEHGRRAYLTEIKSRIATVTPYLDKYWPTTNGGTIVPATDNRPDFNEFPLFLSGNSHDRNVNDVDLWLMHTQEPPKGSDNRNDAALELRNYLESTKGAAIRSRITTPDPWPTTVAPPWSIASTPTRRAGQSGTQTTGPSTSASRVPARTGLVSNGWTTSAAPSRRRPTSSFRTAPSIRSSRPGSSHRTTARPRRR
ncbi:hypothetical protein R2325_02515 [Mycobacteroides chelonae]|nr:hypothetical protein [Mycobacteroides chelonae]